MTDGQLVLDPAEEITAGVLITNGGAVVQPATAKLLQPAPAPEGAPTASPAPTAPQAARIDSAPEVDPAPDSTPTAGGPSA